MSIYDKASLVLIPSGTKTSKVYSQKPVNGDGDFTFSRSTAATRVNADGNIEKETQNLLLQSNSFDTTWSKTNVTLTNGQSGYDGSSDAWLLSKSAAAFTNLIQSVTTSGVNTFSAYAKAGTLTQLTLRDSATNIYARFNLSDGSLITTSGSPIATSIKDIGGGWYRCSITMSMSSASLQIYPDWNQSTAGNIYIQDAQIEQGLVARDYIETTTAAVEGGITDNVPRLDYTDSSCPALLLEPQRRNILPHSEYFDDFATTRSSLDFGHTSPEGLDNAYKLVSDSTAGASHLIKTQNITITASTDYTISAFVKADEVNWVALMFTDTSVSDQTQAWFNISNGTKGTSSSGGSASMSDYDIVDYGNGWYRIYIVADLGGDTTCQARLYLAEGDNDSVWNGDGTSGAYIYGFQIEDNGAGGGTTYATSYIPTYGTSVTRNQDLNLTASPSTSYFGQTEGTIFTEIKINAITSGSYSRVFNLKNSSGSNQIYFQQNDSRINGVVFNGSNQFIGGTSSGFLSVGSTCKIAMAYKDGDYALYVNGTQIATGSASGLGTLAVDRVDFTTLSGNINLGNEVKQSLVFNTRLSNEELAALTTI